MQLWSLPPDLQGVLSIFDRCVYIQRHEAEQLGIVHLGQQPLAALAQHVFGERALAGDYLVNPRFEGL